MDYFFCCQYHSSSEDPEEEFLYIKSIVFTDSHLPILK